MDPQTQVPQPIHPDHEIFDYKKPHHWKRLILETLGIALCVGTAGLIFYLWDYDYRLGQEIDMIEAGIPQIPVIQNTASSTSSVENWKTYRNEEYGFEFKYPSNFYIDHESINQFDGSLYIVIMESDGIRFQVRVRSAINRQGSIPNEGLESYYGYPAKDKISLSGQVAYTYESETGYFDAGERGFPFIAVSSLLNENVYTMEFNGDAKLEKYEKEVLSTFKFISTSKTNPPSNSPCFQAITRARSSITGEIREFPSSCLPEGWYGIGSN